MSVREIIEKIRSDYSEIDWGKNRKSFSRNKYFRILVQYDFEELKSKFSKQTKKRFLIISNFSDSTIDWKSDLRDYFVITELTAPPKQEILKLQKIIKLKNLKTILDKVTLLLNKTFLHAIL